MKFILSLIAAFAVAEAVHGLPTHSGIQRDTPNERRYVLEGDMLLSPAQKAGLIGDKYKWPNATVPVIILPGFAPLEFSKILVALKTVSDATCVRFVFPTLNSPDVLYIYRISTGNCQSRLGRQGGYQEIKLGFGCFDGVGLVMHELLHTLGFRHEQNRYDRDDYVEVNWSNIKSTFKYDFDTYNATDIDLFDIPYDYTSVMHDHAYLHSIDPTVKTMVPKDPNAAIGQRIGFSKSDILRVNRMYNCDK